MKHQIIKHDRERQADENLPTVRSPFNRFFDETFWDPFRLFESPLLPSLGNAQYAPSVDVSETDKEIKIEADIPGYDPKNIEVDVTNNMLTIRGTHEEQAPADKRKWHRRERNYSYAEFTRQILLPDYADGSKADCRVKNGMLMIDIPKKPEAAPTHLEVKAE